MSNHVIQDFENYTSVFFWNFKRMDNVNYNFEVIESLCKTNENGKHNKPIILLIAAVIECTLYDFVRRINEHRKEIIEGLDQHEIDDTRSKTTDVFEPLIAHCRKHNLLRVLNEHEFYANLDLLRKMRNRIHIQNQQQQLNHDEFLIWTNESLQLAGNVLKQICQKLCQIYPRPGKPIPSAKDFPEPWKRPDR